MTQYALRWYAASLTVIVVIWAVVLYWGVRELSHVLTRVP